MREKDNLLTQKDGLLVEKDAQLARQQEVIIKAVAIRPAGST